MVISNTTGHLRCALNILAFRNSVAIILQLHNTIQHLWEVGKNYLQKTVKKEPYKYPEGHHKIQ